MTLIGLGRQLASRCERFFDQNYRAEGRGRATRNETSLSSTWASVSHSSFTQLVSDGSVGVVDSGEQVNFSGFAEFPRVLHI